MDENTPVEEMKEVLDGISRRWCMDEISFHRACLVKVAVEFDKTGDTEAAHRIRFALLALDDATEGVRV